jgi:hypothetical protein
VPEQKFTADGRPEAGKEHAAGLQSAPSAQHQRTEVIVARCESIRRLNDSTGIMSEEARRHYGTYASYDLVPSTLP